MTDADVVSLEAPGSPGSNPDRRFHYTLHKAAHAGPGLHSFILSRGRNAWQKRVAETLVLEVQPGVYGLQVQAINGMGMSDLSPPGEVPRDSSALTVGGRCPHVHTSFRNQVNEFPPVRCATTSTDVCTCTCLRAHGNFASVCICLHTRVCSRMVANIAAATTITTTTTCFVHVPWFFQ